MPRVLMLVAVAGALVWAAALVQVDQRPAPVAHESEAPVQPSPKPAPDVAAPSKPAPAAAAPEATATVAAHGKAPLPLARVQPVGPRSLWATASATMRAARDALAPGAQPVAAGPPEPGDVATGELGEGVLSPEYAAVEREYVYEPRDGAWAAQQEGQIRDLLRSSPLAPQLAIVNCQQTICRVVFERAPEDAFKRLLQVHGLPDLTGLNPNTPYSYRAGQLSVYFTRRSAIIAASP